jgi:REP element-mobilizing transposase RayT
VRQRGFIFAWTGKNACRYSSGVTYYRRKLPHWQPEGIALFVTWRLYGSLPAKTLNGRSEASPGEVFVTYDRFLDKAETGPLWLKDIRIARMVVNAVQFAESQLKLYQLHAFVVMANHVHLLVAPYTALSRITRAVKGYTAREANRTLGKTGQRFWQEESFDHWVRNEEDHRRIVRYIEYNPVAAGLVEKIEDCPWSSATGRGM